MAKTRDREWRAENDASNYPFEDGATLVNNDGQALLAGTFLDALLYPSGVVGALYLSKVTITNSEAVLYLGDDNTDALCYGTIDLLALPDSVVLIDSYGRDCGLLVSEAIRLSLFQAWPNGTYLFTATQTGFVPGVQASAATDSVTGLLLPDGSVAAGDVWLVGGEGVILTTETITVAGVSQTVIRVNAVGDPLFKKALCTEDQYETPRFLRKLIVQKGALSHAVEANSFGDVQITVGSNLAPDTVMRIEPTSVGMRVGLVGEKLQGIV